MGDLCNKCATHAPVRKGFYTHRRTVRWKAGKPSMGMGWDKKQHKVIIPGVG